MKRRNRFVIGLLSAILTFSALYTVVGTEHWSRSSWKYHHHHHWDHHDHHDHQDTDTGNDAVDEIENE